MSSQLIPIHPQYARRFYFGMLSTALSVGGVLFARNEAIRILAMSLLFDIASNMFHVWRGSQDCIEFYAGFPSGEYNEDSTVKDRVVQSLNPALNGILYGIGMAPYYTILGLILAVCARAFSLKLSVTAKQLFYPLLFKQILTAVIGELIRKKSDHVPDWQLPSDLPLPLRLGWKACIMRRKTSVYFRRYSLMALVSLIVLQRLGLVKVL